MFSLISSPIRRKPQFLFFNIHLRQFRWRMGIWRFLCLVSNIGFLHFLLIFLEVGLIWGSVHNREDRNLFLHPCKGTWESNRSYHHSCASTRGSSSCEFSLCYQLREHMCYFHLYLFQNQEDLQYFLLYGKSLGLQLMLYRWTLFH